MTDDELKALNESGLHKKTPYAIYNVSRSQFSVARHYGGVFYGGDRYFYVPPTDELIRHDVVKWLKKYRAGLKKEKVAEVERRQGKMFENH